MSDGRVIQRNSADLFSSSPKIQGSGWMKYSPLLGTPPSPLSVQATFISGQDSLGSRSEQRVQ